VWSQSKNCYYIKDTATGPGTQFSGALGSAVANCTADTASGSGTMTWTPSASATDRAGNAASTSTVTESGSGDKEF